MNLERNIYPFTAIVGQERMKFALILNVINPSLGGVLIRGEKGTAKSTAVRALADLLPERDQISGCKYSCSPDHPDSLCNDCAKKLQEGHKPETVRGKMKVIDLPIGATEDRVVGTLDIEHAIKSGEKKFEAGILAQSNRNILYVDEINLLDDHVVDVLLDSAAMGVNFIEREGISYAHPAKFTLIGTMNPEEGDIRPQLIDRFGLAVDVMGESDPKSRVEVIKRRMEFEKDPEAFLGTWEMEQEELAKKITQASKLLNEVTFDDSLLLMIANISTVFEVDGHRSDIVMLKTALTIAAFHQRRKITSEDIKEAAIYVMPHRMRRKPFDDSSYAEEIIHEKINEILP